MNRIVTNDLTRHVLPLRTQSITGARMLHFLNYTVDAIYLDGAQVPTLPRLLPSIFLQAVRLVLLWSQ